MHPPFVANTDQAWFDYLSQRSGSGSLDEVNFWQPMAVTPMKRMELGSPVFFRLKRPHYAIAGYGFFAHFEVLPLDMAWEVFGEKNGDPDELSFRDPPHCLEPSLSVNAQQEPPCFAIISALARDDVKQRHVSSMTRGGLWSDCEVLRIA